MPWNFRDAIKGDDPHWLVQDARRQIVRHGRALTPGEVACFKRHAAVWRDLPKAPISIGYLCFRTMSFGIQNLICASHANIVSILALIFSAYSPRGLRPLMLSAGWAAASWCGSEMIHTGHKHISSAERARRD